MYLFRKERHVKYKRAIMMLEVDGGTKQPVIELPNHIIKNILTCDKAPRNTEDWKYYLTLYDGPMPSQVKTIRIISLTPTTMGITWELNDGV